MTFSMLIASTTIHCMCMTVLDMNASCIILLRIMLLSMLIDSIRRLFMTILGMTSLNVLLVSMMSLSIMKDNIMKFCME